MTRVGIVVFPGTNCEHDTAEAITLCGGQPELLWHADPDLGDVDAVVLPGGFAHGDYLRPGAIARFSPIMASIADLARAGGVVVGICNGFQVLTESGLLPGALCKNRGLKFLCRPAQVRVESTASSLTVGCEVGDLLNLPVNHFSGAFTCDDATLNTLRDNDQIVLRYAENPNGSTADIAGICSPGGNVVGLMPHPERSCDPLGSQDGMRLFASLLVAASKSAWTRSG